MLESIPTTTAATLTSTAPDIKKKLLECARNTLAMSKADYIMQRYAFPAAFVAAHVVIIYSLLRRRGERSVGKLTLLTLGFIELAMFWTFVPMSLGAFKPFFSTESFRRFYFAATPLQGSTLNILSGCDSFLTLLVCYEFRLVMQNSKAKSMIATARRQGCLYLLILVISVLASLYTFTQSYVFATRCNGEILRPTGIKFLISMRLFDICRQYVYPLIVVVLPSLLIIHTNLSLARTAGDHCVLPTEANELIGSSTKPTGSVRRLRMLLLAFTACFVLPHMFSLVPLLLQPPAFTPQTMLTAFAITNSLLFFSRIVCYALLHAISSQLAKMGVVHVY